MGVRIEEQYGKKQNNLHGTIREGTEQLRGTIGEDRGAEFENLTGPGGAVDFRSR